MIRKLAAPSAASVIALNAAAGAAEVSRNGDALYHRCSSFRPDALATCFAYVGGVTDAVALNGGNQGYREIGGYRWRTSPGATKIQEAAILIRYAEQQPLLRKSVSASLLVAAALQTAWPCRRT
jgi:Rap1a immunity proteins